MQLMESLPRIAMGSNQIMYSTHSHYMVHPNWLDQAFVVSNLAVDYKDVAESDMRVRTRHTEIRVEKYREFVGKNPDKLDYFQPVLDKLDVAPSRLDVLKHSVLLERKGDYLILEYGRRVILDVKESFATVATPGAAGMNELIGLFLGWRVPFVVCLDDDKAGKTASANYRKGWALTENRVFTLASVAADLKGKRIEAFLEPSDMKIIAEHFGVTAMTACSKVSPLAHPLLQPGARTVACRFA
jgi:hypothetical protein